MIKIGIMGTHGSGKTSFAFNLLARLKSEEPGLRIFLLNEIARQCPLPVNRGACENAQRWIFHRQISAEIEASCGMDILVCDRTILDNLAYARRAGFINLTAQCLAECLDWLKTYDEIHFLRPYAAPADDGFRDTDLQFQADIDAILVDWLRAFKLSVIEH